LGIYGWVLLINLSLWFIKIYPNQFKFFKIS